MGDNSAIEWTDATWNPATGCTKISPGCKNCYAERLARRLRAMRNPRYVNGFDLTLHDDLIDLPLRWRASRRIFVNSMSDLFHEDIPLDFIQKVFSTMRAAHWHQFQILTKRSHRLRTDSGEIDWPENVWQGVSVESAKHTHRIDDLRNVTASIRFLSIEPLLSEIPHLDLRDIHWVIVGGESGPNHRSVHPEWVRSIRDQCLAQRVPFFFKQWGGPTPKAGGRTLDHQLWNQMPAV